MPRIVICHHCHSLTRIPDVAKGTPMVPARLEWRDGEQFMFKDEKGLPVMVAAFDPILEDFVTKHEHGRPEHQVIGGLIQVYGVDQRTWDAMDVVTQIQRDLEKQHNTWYEDRDEYRTGATKCYNEHGNPDLSTGCPDYLDDSKRLGSSAVPPKYRQYLCYLCPYQQSYINVELRRRKGAYK
jgi:hypothetical protein